MNRFALALAALALAACETMPTTTTATLPPADPNAVTLSASVEASWFWGTNGDIAININGETVIAGEWDSDLRGKWRDRAAWAKCHSRVHLLKASGYEIYCDVYLDGAKLGTVSATEK